MCALWRAGYRGRNSRVRRGTGFESTWEWIMKLTLAIILLAIGTLSMAPQDQEDPHDRQPATCNNLSSNSHPCDCNHAKECPTKEAIPEDSRCQVYCRHD